jgi:hypothetical protein
MREWMVSDAHIDALVNAWVRFDQGHSVTCDGEDEGHTFRLTSQTATRLGQKLLAEYRCDANDRDNKDDGAPTYRFTPMTEDPDPVVILKLISYYERQSCGHRGWETSEARKFCEDLRLACIRALPGYDAAPWRIDDLQEAELPSRPSGAAERSSNDAPREQEIIEWGPLVLTVQGRACVVAGRDLYLTYMEYELLRFLATQPGKVFTRETLLNRVWGYEYYGGARTVDVHVRRLRAKFGEEHAHLIETVRSVGYRFGQGDDLGMRSVNLDLDAIEA